jgi:hypothetical protein
MQQLDYNNGNGVFLRGPCRDVVSKGQSQLSVDSSARQAVKRGPQSVKLKNLHCWQPLSRERLVMTQQAGKGLAGTVVICQLWRLVVALSFVCCSSSF